MPSNPYTWEAHLNHQRILEKAKKLSEKVKPLLEDEVTELTAQFTL
ncbi:hypothetical protein [Legionella busanensis]|nr:hypothetical protein [Legionella busanensis]